jgi:hypothetical protein
MSEKTKIKRRRQPDFYIDKKQGLRHLLHAAIRLTLEGEDPFAITVLGQAADKVLLDLLKHAKIDDPASFADRIVPEHRRQFFEIYREAFNFLKHADNDPQSTLPVHNIVHSNELLIFINVVRYQRLYSEITRHMQCFIGLIGVLHPTLIKWGDEARGVQLKEQRKLFSHMTRRDAIRLIREQTFADPVFIGERTDDLESVGKSHSWRLSGKPGPEPFKIPVK